MKYSILVLFLLGSIIVFAQNPRLVGKCEGCEAIFEQDMTALSATDTLPDYHDNGPKLKLTGVIYKPDGTTPAPDITLYIYHTDQSGVYPKKENETGWASKHGYLRGIVKTGKDGTYTFYTLKPGVYPNRKEPAHVHPTILEPDGRYYWIHASLFEGDSLIKPGGPDKIRGGGSNILKLEKSGDLLIGRRDIMLGKNVPGYER